MDPELLSLLSIFGLATATGINASLPLLLVGLAARGGWLELAPPYDVLGATPFLALIGVLVVAGFFVDRYPAYRKDFAELEMLLALAAGAVVSGVQAGAIANVSPGLVVALGLTTTGATHLSRTTIGRPLSALPGARRVAALSLSGAAIAAPWLVPILLLVFGLLLVLAVFLATRLLSPLLKLFGRLFPEVAGFLLNLVGRFFPGLARRLPGEMNGSRPARPQQAFAGSSPVQPRSEWREDGARSQTSHHKPAQSHDDVSPFPPSPNHVSPGEAVDAGEWSDQIDRGSRGSNGHIDNVIDDAEWDR